MKLGVAGMLGDGSAEAARLVRAMGVTAASWHLPHLELAEDRDHLRRVRDNIAAAGLELCQLLPPEYPSLVDHDPAVRAAGVEALVRMLRASREMGSVNVYVRPGSLNPKGGWTPHRENHLPETRDRLVESLRALAPHAEELGVPLALEGHVVSPLDTPAVVREVIDRVGSPSIGFNADPVNMVRTIDQAYDNTSLVGELFDLLGDRMLCAHAKDVTVTDRLVVHVDECVCGRGYLDQELFLKRFAACCPNGVVLIEHLAPEDVPEARLSLLAAAERAGVAFEGQ